MARPWWPTSSAPGSSSPCITAAWLPWTQTARTLLAIGDIAGPIFPRSSSKPIQALAMLRAGLDLDGELLALASASHSGEPFHLDGILRILAGAGLSEQDLQNTPDLPYDET